MKGNKCNKRFLRNTLERRAMENIQTEQYEGSEGKEGRGASLKQVFRAFPEKVPSEQT